MTNNPNSGMGTANDPMPKEEVSMGNELRVVLSWLISIAGGAFMGLSAGNLPMLHIGIGMVLWASLIRIEVNTSK